MPTSQDLSDIFPPAWIYGNPASMAAVNAWNQAHLKTPPAPDPWYSPPAPAQTARDAITQALVQQQAPDLALNAGAGGVSGAGGAAAAGTSDTGSTGTPGDTSAPGDTSTPGSTPGDTSTPGSTQGDTSTPGTPGTPGDTGPGTSGTATSTGPASASASTGGSRLLSARTGARERIRRPAAQTPTIGRPSAKSCLRCAPTSKKLTAQPLTRGAKPCSSPSTAPAATSAAFRPETPRRTTAGRITSAPAPGSWRSRGPRQDPLQPAA